jgi:predicted ATPase
MPITKVIIAGFKSLRERVEIPLMPLTLMFGPNSAGKSTVKDALVEFKRCLEQDDSRGGLSDFVFRYVYPSKLAHQLSESDDFGDAECTDCTLGCEIEDFRWMGCLDLMTETQSSQIGFDMFESLRGGDRSIRFELVQEARDLDSSFLLHVDGLDLANFSSRNLAPADCAPLSTQATDENFWEFADEFGVLRLNLGHSTLDAKEFHLEVQALLHAVAQSTASAARKMVWLDDDILHIRTNSIQRRIHNWEKHPFVHTSGLPADLIGINEHIRSISLMVNELVRQIEYAIAKAISFSHVGGSRQLLAAEDVTAGWRTLKMPIDDYSTGSSIKDYAHWLGVASTLPKGMPPLLAAAVNSVDDFVNEVISAGLFTAQRYRLNAAVSVRREESTCSGKSTWSDSVMSINSELFLRDEQGRDLGFEQVGSGVSYVLPVLTSLWGADLSWIEQPELHLHPAAQCEVGDVLVRAFNRGHFSIVETHSEHLLLRILRRIRQTSEGKVRAREFQCQPEAVAVLYFSPQGDGSTRIHQLRVTRGGDFMDRWPDGFFEERSRELFDE